MGTWGQRYHPHFVVSLGEEEGGRGLGGREGEKGCGTYSSRMMLERGHGAEKRRERGQGMMGGKV